MKYKPFRLTVLTVQQQFLIRQLKEESQHTVIDDEACGLRFFCRIVKYICMIMLVLSKG